MVGPQSYHHLPQLLARAKSEGRALETEFPVEDKFGFLSPPLSRLRSACAASPAFVTLQEGRDKFCTSCVVPYTRGVEVSRRSAKIVDDVKRLADNGVREITLIGQNVNAYHGRRSRTGRPGRSAGCCIGLPKSKVSCGCATPPAIPATSARPFTSHGMRSQTFVVIHNAPGPACWRSVVRRRARRNIRVFTVDCGQLMIDAIS